MRIVLVVLWQHLRRWPLLIAAYIASTTFMIALWVAEPLLGRAVIDSVGLIGTMDFKKDAFMSLFFAWIGISLVMSVIQAIQKMVCWRAMNKTYLTFQEEKYAHVLYMDSAQHAQRRAGAIVKKIDNAADTIWDIGFQLFQVIIPSLLAGFIFVGIAFTVNVYLTLIVTILLGMYGVVLIIITNRVHPIQAAISRLWVSIIGRAYDVMLNILPVKSAAAEQREIDRVKYWHRIGFRLQTRADYMWAMLEGINMFVLLRALTVGLGVYLITQGQLTLGELFFFTFISFRLISPIEIVSGFLPKWNEKVEKIRMGKHIGEIPSTVQNLPNARILPDLQGTITFENLSFSYEQSGTYPLVLENDDEEEINILDPHAEHMDEHSPHHRPLELLQRFARSSEEPLPTTPQHALSHFSLAVHAGEHIALVGHSGAGKSTIASLINRFYDPTHGRILVDGIDLKELDLLWWRSCIGLVLQDNTMFNDTVMSNIRYARPEAPDDEVISAAKRASAHDFIIGIPKGYQTQVGERGIRLSGGERQRLAIARAILKQPKIVVLDEATSALDSITERDVQEGIRELIADRTSFIIAHRLSTVRSVDRIAVLKNGSILACASHDELLKTCPTYKEMVELQSHGMLAE
ncbi:hypothetical protein A2635_00240 [Candidatus Peribacteria bacterium RIFCSPHIGHO2_01_FULL_51_9]|nr:MAG: hypothetical protein A2635_00240 [Candidatus Peribacteria bacterium RIFCSPHIGHO2_01_FULL_51_9]